MNTYIRIKHACIPFEIIFLAMKILKKMQDNIRDTKNYLLMLPGLLVCYT